MLRQGGRWLSGYNYVRQWFESCHGKTESKLMNRRSDQKE